MRWFSHKGNSRSLFNCPLSILENSGKRQFSIKKRESKEHWNANIENFKNLPRMKEKSVCEAFVPHSNFFSLNSISLRRAQHCAMLKIWVKSYFASSLCFSSRAKLDRKTFFLRRLIFSNNQQQHESKTFHNGFTK